MLDFDELFCIKQKYIVFIANLYSLITVQFIGNGDKKMHTNK